MIKPDRLFLAGDDAPNGDPADGPNGGPVGGPVGGRQVSPP
jgi:hypothetical protein